MHQEPLLLYVGSYSWSDTQSKSPEENNPASSICAGWEVGGQGVGEWGVRGGRAGGGSWGVRSRECKWWCGSEVVVTVDGIHKGGIWGRVRVGMRCGNEAGYR